MLASALTRIGHAVFALSNEQEGEH
jgi:hypothetical protein